MSEAPLVEGVPFFAYCLIAEVDEVVSERKRQANERNAKHSTGPKDTRRTKYNAQKHGLLSKAAIIETGDAKEDPHERESLLEALREDLEPEGATEEFLVDRIASCQWRLRRAQRAETGEIRRGADSAVMDAMDATADRYELALQQEEMSFVPGSGGGSYGGLAKTTPGIARIKRVLDGMRALVEEQGSLTPDQLTDVTNIYGHREGSFGLTLTVIALKGTNDLQATDGDETNARSDGPSPERRKKALLALIDSETTKLKNETELVAEKEQLEWDAAVLSRHLPSDEVLGKILRYETTIERQMYRALKELRELQAARRARSTRLGTSHNGV